MDTERLIPVDECCARYEASYSFIVALQESGLIETQTVEEKLFIHADQLHDLEKYIRLYYDLNINPEGIEAVVHLLQRINNQQCEIASLRERLKLYEPEGERRE